jgi:hypothetical protein
MAKPGFKGYHQASLDGTLSRQVKAIETRAASGGKPLFILGILPGKAWVFSCNSGGGIVLRFVSGVGVYVVIHER